MGPTWRETRPGDLFVLLVPSEGEVTPAGQMQLELQAFFGGRPVNPVHVTCERFELSDQQRLEEITRRLKQQAKMQSSFPVTAFSVKTIRSDFRGVHILKWLVDLSDPLSQWINFVGDTLDAIGARRFYGSLGGIWTVTALEGIEEMNTKPFLSQAAFPQYLFTARQIILSRILGPDKYETLGRFDLSDQSSRD
jgi:hypothetical protein